MDEPVGRMLEIMKYNFVNSSPERQEIYEAHIAECAYCRRAYTLRTVKTRGKGLAYLSGGILLTLLSVWLIYLIFFVESVWFLPWVLLAVSVPAFASLYKGLTMISTGQEKIDRLSDQRVDAVPHEPNDRRLDWIVTEESWMRARP